MKTYFQKSLVYGKNVAYHVQMIEVLSHMFSCLSLSYMSKRKLVEAFRRLGFTLTELVVVITILTILATIATIAFR